MEPSRQQVKTHPRRLIERPRLTKLLDESDARVILLLAPAGYGKTTLARQWIKTVGRSIWLSCTHEHRDVVTFASDIATRLEPCATSAPRAVSEYIRAQSTPQRSSLRIGSILADHLTSAETKWIVIDDYHEIIQAPEVEQLVDVLVHETSCRFIAASRLRPSWATARRILYGEIREVTRDMLAMTEEESVAFVGRRNGLAQLARQAEGWPAVLALAANARELPPPNAVLPSALHSYLAEELFNAAPHELQDQLIRLSLLPTLEPTLITDYLGVEGGQLVHEARGLGFLAGDDTPTLHPLVREFLLEKLSERPDARAQVHEAIGWSIREAHWGRALELVSRFACDDLIEPVLRECYKPLARNGQIATLSGFAAQVRLRPTFPPPAVDLVQAEVALRDGQLALAGDLSTRAQAQLPLDHPLRSRAGAIRGHCGLQRADHASAEEAFADARATALDDRDESEALHGIALARIMGESSDAREAVDELHARRHESPTLLVRAATAEIARRRFSEGIAGSLPIEEAQHTLLQVDDPRVRSSFAYTVAYALAQRAEYLEANTWLKRLADDIAAFDLEFAKPHAQWVTALVRLGTRRFGETERLLQSLEDSNDSRQQPHQAGNVRLLRARLLLQTGKANEAERSQPNRLTHGTTRRGGPSTWRHAHLRWHVSVRMTKRCKPRTSQSTPRGSSRSGCSLQRVARS